LKISQKHKGELSEKCDWIQFTVKFYKDLTWPTFISPLWKSIPPIAKFTDGQENAQGIRLYWNKTRPNMGKHIVISGSCCTILGENLDELLQYVMQEDFSVTRLDLCVDMFRMGFKPEKATKLIRKGEIRTHAQKCPINEDAMVGGYTQYIGSKSSATYVRIYDKASEMGQEGDWIRIEIVYGKRAGKSALEAYLRTKSVRGMVRHFMDFPTWKEWQKIFDAPQTKVRYEYKTSATREWLMGTVTKAMAREMLLEDDQSFYLNFVQKIREEFIALTTKTDDIQF